MTQVRVGPLVRAASATSVTIWVELAQPGIVQVQAWPMSDSQDAAVTVSMRTVTVGGRYYAAPQLRTLQPATWYTYRLCTSAQGEEAWQEPALLQCFRTLDDVAAPQTAATSLRLAYGSCRKLDAPETDLLGAFGAWLLHHREQRESTWPHLLLLIGDQIYADQPAEELVREHPRLRAGATSFEDFALSYEYAWARDEQVRQALAVLPTYMIFDDHEVLNDWNIIPQWRKKIISSGQEQMLVDGLVAYWIYQGWGNLVNREGSEHPLVAILDRAGRDGEDALDALRATIKAHVCGETSLAWHYAIATQPAIFVTNTRADRTSIFSDDERAICAPTRIMDRAQMDELGAWMRTHDQPFSMLVSSVPLLLPPFIGFAEYLMGVRLWLRRPSPLRWLGLKMARRQIQMAVKTSFDHWPVFSVTWREFVQLLDARQHDIVVLSGDVHFSYGARARRSTATAGQAHLYQFVSTPIQNALSPRDALLVRLQSRITRLAYGGLITQMLPLQARGTGQALQRDLLFCNTLALIEARPDGEAGYRLQHDYLGVVDGHIEIIASTRL